MFELDEAQRMLQDAVRAWCEAQLAPAVPALERGELLPYDLLRRLARELGLAETLAHMAERRVAKLRGDRSDARDSARGEGGFGADPMLTSVLLKEISRVSPGFGMVLLATLGCGRAILSRGSDDEAAVVTLGRGTVGRKTRGLKSEV